MFVPSQATEECSAHLNDRVRLTAWSHLYRAVVWGVGAFIKIVHQSPLAYFSPLAAVLDSVSITMTVSLCPGVGHVTTSGTLEYWSPSGGQNIPYPSI